MDPRSSIITNDSFDSSAEKLRTLLHSVQSQPKNMTSTINYLAAKHNFPPDNLPKYDDLIRLVQSTENMNQQLITENRYLKNEIGNIKLTVMKLIEENAYLHNELKNVTVHEILYELENEKDQQQQPQSAYNELIMELKQKKDQLHQSQIMINDLKNMLNKPEKNGNDEKQDNDNIRIDSGEVCTKCGGISDLEIKRKEIETLKRNNEQLSKSLEYTKLKLEEMKSTETESYAQIKKYAELVKHLEFERDQTLIDKEQYTKDNLNLKKKLEEFINEYNQILAKDKQTIELEFQDQMKKLEYQIQISENVIAKNEALIDRLTRDKVSLISEVEDYKIKCNSIDTDTQQINKLKNQYRDAISEKNLLALDLKRVRHDYDLYVKQNDQDKFCMRDELSTVRNRLINIEHELLKSKEQLIQVTEENNKLQAEIINCKHAKETIENSRLEVIKTTIEDYKNREVELANAIVQLQTRHCLKVKELEDLADVQRGLIDKLRAECKTLTSHLEESQIKNDETKHELRQQIEELRMKSTKYEHSSKEFEEQNAKHVDLEERLKARLKELTLKAQQQHEMIQRLTSKETKLELNNQQLIQDVAEARKQLALYSIPTRMQMLNKVYETATTS